MTGKKSRNTIKKSILKKVILMMFAVTLVSFNALGISATDEEVILAIDNSDMRMGTSANLSLTLRNAQGTIQSIDGLEAFDIMSSGQSTSTSIINGDVSKEVSMNYVIVPNQVGEVTLIAKVLIDGKVVESNPLEINITQRSQDLEGEQQDIFIRTVISDDDIYFGEKTVVTYELYSRYNLDGFDFTQDLDFSDFVSQVNDGEGSASYTTINGNKYVMYKVKQIVLSPIDTGDFIIPAFDLQANVSTGDFFGSYKPFYLQSEPIDIHVRNIPEGDQPKGYDGLVGSFEVKSGYDKETLEFGDPLTLSATLSGEGNLERLTTLSDWIDLSAFSVYETVKDEKETIGENGQETSKTFEVILVPKKAGTFEIGDIKIPYFNTEKGEYDELLMKGTSIEVSGGDDQSSIESSESGTGSSGNAMVVNQVYYSPKDDDAIIIRFDRQVLIVVGIVMFMLIIFVIIGLWIYRVRKNSKELYKYHIEKIHRAQNAKELYESFNNMMVAMYEIDIRSSDIEGVALKLSDDKLISMVKQVVFYLEHDQYYNSDRFEEVKALAQKIPLICKGDG